MTSALETWTTCYRKAVVASNSNERAGARRSTFQLHSRPGIWAALLLLLVLLLCFGAAPAASAGGQIKSLDEQVQEIKSDALSIAAELIRLEEKLLYPSNTQVAFFVSLAAAQNFRLDSLRLQVDGELVAHHIHSFKELEALEKGGVQRVYQGNVATGEHRLEVAVAGKLPNGSDFTNVAQLSFEKAVEPGLVEVSLTGGSSGAKIELGKP
jgi:hypothetical protein